MTSVGNLLGGRIADRFGHGRVVIVGMIGLSFFFWSFMNLTGTVQLLALASLGISVGATTPSSLVMAQDAWPQAIGVASSLVMGVAWMPSSIGAWIVGTLADQRSLSFAFSTLTFVPVIGVSCCYLHWLATSIRG